MWGRHERGRKPAASEIDEVRQGRRTPLCASGYGARMQRSIRNDVPGSIAPRIPGEAPGPNCSGVAVRPRALRNIERHPLRTSALLQQVRGSTPQMRSRIGYCAQWVSVSEAVMYLPESGLACGSGARSRTAGDGHEFDPFVLSRHVPPDSGRTPQAGACRQFPRPLGSSGIVASLSQAHGR